VIATMIRMVYPFLPTFARGLGVELTLLTRSLTLRSLSGVLSPFLASVADTRGRKTGMLLGLLIFCSGTAVVVIWPTFVGFVLALILTSLGKLTFDPSMQAYLGDRVKYNKRGRVMAIAEIGWSLSFIFGIPLAGLLVARGGWNSPFALLTGLGLLSLFLMVWLLPKDPESEFGHPSMFRNFSKVFSSRSAIASLLITMLISLAHEVITLVFGVWMEDSFGLKIIALGAASAVIGVGELSGEGLAGAIADRLGIKRAVGVGMFCMTISSAALPLLGNTLTGALIGLFLFYISFEFAFVCIIPLMTEVLPEARGTLMSLRIGGASIGRAIGNSIGLPLYNLGFWVCALMAGVISMILIFILRRVEVGQVSTESGDGL
jgi:predicted MFS family arabinose efflux permease